MNKNLAVKNVRLDEIDDQVIQKIRPVDEASEDYRILENAINKDGQRNPITLRLLTEEEKSKACKGSVYGIIDGHHRFHIARKFNMETILAVVDDTPPDPIQDAILAFRMNTTSIRMSPAEKGKVICDLMKATNRSIDEIGKSVFGLKTAMIYRSVQKYKELTGEPTIKKLKESNKDFDPENFRGLLVELFNGIGFNFISPENFSVKEDKNREEKLKLIKEIKKQLTLLEKRFSATS